MWNVFCLKVITSVYVSVCVCVWAHDVGSTAHIVLINLGSTDIFKWLHDGTFVLPLGKL